MDSYSELIDELAVMSQRRDTDRRIDAANHEIDEAMRAGCPAIEVARMEAVRNRLGAHRVWTGAGA